MRRLAILAAVMLSATPAAADKLRLSYAVVDTNQTACYDDRGAAACPRAGAPFHGQDGQWQGLAPHYRDNGDGTVSDLQTGLMWQKGFRQMSWGEAPAAAAADRTGGHADWRVPTIKELYSLIDFSGATGTGRPDMQGAPADARPYLDTRAFVFEYPSRGRFIDAQYITSTAYVGRVMSGQAAFFGVNFADGRIKGYPQGGGPGGKAWYARWVRGNPAYGHNIFVDNRDGTVGDRATGLTWTQGDSGDAAFRPLLAATRTGDGRLDWGEALAFCDGLRFAGHDDWRLPNAKELHSIVDYGRAPDVTNSAVIDPLFRVTTITDPEGKRDWPFFWSSTSHLDGRRPGDFAVYIAFGRAQGHMDLSRRGNGPPPADQAGPPSDRRGPPPDRFGPPEGRFGPSGGRPEGGGGGGDRRSLTLLDVHGAGAQRSSPKSGDESRLPIGAGPQGDVLRIYNYARCVRGEAVAVR